MVPSIEISSQTFARLQACAIPLVDNIETVITRLIDFYEAGEGAPVPGSGAEAANEIRQFNPLSPPVLTSYQGASGRILRQAARTQTGELERSS